MVRSLKTLEWTLFLQAKNAANSSTDFINFRLTNVSYNGILMTGTTEILYFNVYFPSRNSVPTINSVVFNDVGLCPNGELIIL